MSLAQKGRWVALGGLALLGGVYVRALAFTPIERFQGPAQKIFYVHVPSAEVGTVFAAIVLVTGPIWGKPVWGTWWTWDARLTSTLFLFFLLIGYQVLRGAVADPGLRARYCAVLGICAVVLVGFVHMSVYLFPTLHPQPIVIRPGKPALPPEMLITLLVSFGVFLILYAGFVMQRYAIAEQRVGATHG
jgi:heme exporter protein C